MSTSEDIGKLVLRITLAILILLHGVSKLQNGIDFISGLVSGAGLPSAFAYLVYIGEVVAPLLVLIGLFTRPAALLIAVNMIVAIVLVHMGELFTFTNSGGWALELQGMFLFTAIAISLLGAGRYSLDAKVRRKKGRVI